ncbi:MAG: hypothetical protein QOH33_1417 [Paraburkholderia sp.]|nr:hypothetical protein [Paraburkholderia sp.]
MGGSLGGRNEKRAERPVLIDILAERVGFEPTVRYNRTPDFESGAFDHSATFPSFRIMLRVRPSPYCLRISRHRTTLFASWSLFGEAKILVHLMPHSKLFFAKTYDIRHLPGSMRRGSLDALESTEIRTQCSRHRHRAIRVLEVLEHGDKRAPHCQPRAV